MAGFSPDGYYGSDIWNIGEISSDTFSSMQGTSRYIQDTWDEDYTADEETDETDYDETDDAVTYEIDDDYIDDEDRYERCSDYWRVFVFATFYCLQCGNKNKSGINDWSALAIKRVRSESW
ncbi:MAG: hypothetical protein Ta2E_11250 [Mycoplasmoidaceae bacterium]|nr:MAG: hypothetical protein Ta2E_11250 [Mycoplasmoidaceae bacterium]